MANTSFRKTALFLALLVFIPLFLAEAKMESGRILLSSPESVEKDPMFKRAAAQPSSPAALDKIKIQYLISRMRQSPYAFIRNRERHTGKRAASHLAMKYASVSGRVKTPAEFIEHIAARSSFTGEVYLMDVEGEKVEVRKVLHDELAFLEEKLKETPL